MNGYYGQHQPQLAADAEGLTLSMVKEEMMGYRMQVSATQAFSDAHRDAAYEADHSVADHHTGSFLSLFGPALVTPTSVGKAHQHMMGCQVNPYSDSFQIAVTDSVPEPVGALTVSKTVAATEGAFPFRVTLDGKTISGTVPATAESI